MSWWRRNRIALPAMVLALGALAWPLSEPARDIWWSRNPHVAAEPDGEGWASIDGRRVRIVTFDEVRDFPDDDDEAPEGLTVWRAELTSEVTGSGATESLACEAQLADADGATYSAGPSYLPSFDDDSFSVNCGGGEEPGGIVYFLLPAAAEPAHLTLTTSELLPDFWRLPVP